ncbi:hypothetical protein [Pseudomonas sp. O11]|uniref:hypothetical protein n=1 Tax=Pseudomonas sp. O11 TaxID=3159446 RepID=UPI00387AE83F
MNFRGLGKSATESRCYFKRWLKFVFCPWPSAQNVLIFLAAIILLSLVKLNSSEWASWVQAIGSVAAIWAALIIGRKQLAAQQAAEIEGRRAKALAFQSVVRYAVEQAENINSYIQFLPDQREFISCWNREDLEIIDGAIDSLRAIPVHELGSYELIFSFNIIFSCLVRLKGAAQRLAEKIIDDERRNNEYANIKSQYCKIEKQWRRYLAFSEFK